jgi:hypothetical protein
MFAGPTAPCPCLRDDPPDAPDRVAQPVLVALGAVLATFGLMNAGAVAGGARVGPIAWPRMRPRS